MLKFLLSFLKFGNMSFIVISVVMAVYSFYIGNKNSKLKSENSSLSQIIKVKQQYIYKITKQNSTLKKNISSCDTKLSELRQSSVSSIIKELEYEDYISRHNDNNTTDDTLVF